MSERITEAELRDLEYVPMLPGVNGFVLVPMPVGLRERLVSEVRRLQTLVASVLDDPRSQWAWENSVGDNQGEVGCAWCRQSSGHDRDCPWPALDAEANAIRASRL